MSRSYGSDGGQPAPTHYLRENRAVWTPPSIISLDTETRVVATGETEIQSLRLWVAKHRDRRDVRPSQGPISWGRGTTPGDLAAWLVERARGRRTVWVYAHNLAFDLCTTALPITLGAQGWKVSDFSIRSISPWMRLGNGRTVLTVCDSWSWLPEALGSLAARYGRAKEDLPADDAEPEEWWARCETDVDLLDQAVGDLMDWWDRHQLGRWTISGPSSGWNAWRHRGGPWKVLIEPDPEILAHDRLAPAGGRRDIQRAGDLGQGRYVEVDFTNAYATVAAHLPLPYQRGGTFAQLPVDHKVLDSERWGILAEVEVDTPQPRYPMRWRGVIWYPVGRFRTVLASPEIQWARDNGDLVAIGPGRYHQLAPHLEGWGRWILDVTSGLEPDSPPVAQVAAKAWGRSVIGRFAARGQRTEQLGTVEGLDWQYMDGWDHQAGAHGGLVTMAGQTWWATYDQEGENTYPAVLAWVASHVRARLGRLLDWLPRGLWVQADTDGAILDLTRAGDLVRAGLDISARTRDAWGAAAQLCQLAEPVTWPLVPRPKREHQTIRIMGAQHLITDVERRLAGIRRDAVETSPWAFKVREWPKLRWQMAHGRPGEYHRPEKAPRVRRPTAHRWITEDGEAWPPVATITPEGESVLTTWESSWASIASRSLANPQYRGLDGLY